VWRASVRSAILGVIGCPLAACRVRVAMVFLAMLGIVRNNGRVVLPLNRVRATLATPRVKCGATFLAR